MKRSRALWTTMALSAAIGCGGNTATSAAPFGAALTQDRDQTRWRFVAFTPLNRNEADVHMGPLGRRAGEDLDLVWHARLEVVGRHVQWRVRHRGLGAAAETNG
jgi:hypothetical protein